MEESNDIEEYILTHIEPESDYLKRLYRDTFVNLLRPRMASGHLQGRVLKMFVRMINPLNILEIGTFTGYSALCMAEGLNERGHLYTFEINDEQEDFTRPWIEQSPYADKIDFIIGDAMKLVPQMNIIFDMAFIDGNKRNYIAYFDMVMKYLRIGGFILVDNTLWDGHVLNRPAGSDKQTEGIMDFNDYIKDNSHIEKVILPLRDGLTILQKIE